MTIYKLYIEQGSNAQQVEMTTALNNAITKPVHLRLIYYNPRILNIYANKKKKE